MDKFAEGRRFRIRKKSHKYLGRGRSVILSEYHIIFAKLVLICKVLHELGMAFLKENQIFSFWQDGAIRSRERAIRSAYSRALCN